MHATTMPTPTSSSSVMSSDSTRHGPLGGDRDGALSAAQAKAAERRQWFVSRVAWLHGGLGGVAFAAAVVLTAEPVWMGIGTGAAVAWANFRAMAGLLQRLTTGDMQARSFAVGLLMLKLLLLAGSVLAILTLLKPDPMAFAAGLTLTPLSLLLVSAFQAVTGQAATGQAATGQAATGQAATGQASTFLPSVGDAASTAVSSRSATPSFPSSPSVSTSTRPSGAALEVQG